MSVRTFRIWITLMALASVLLAAFTIAVALRAEDTRGDVAVSRTRDILLYRNAINSCERVNHLREVVYANTVEAAKLQPNATYAEQVHILRSVPGFNPADGSVNCRAVIPKP